jgi:hypothetical protein
MDLDGYFDKVSEAVNACISKRLSVQDYVEDLTRDEPETAKEIIEVRKSLLTQQDKDSLSGYLFIGYFRDFSSEERMALFSYLFDISRALDIKSLNVRFEQYGSDHPIFSKDSTLFDLVRTKTNGSKDNELLDSSGFNCVYGSEIFKRKGFYYKLDPHLPPAIYTYSKTAFPDVQIFIRLDPSHVYDAEPTATLCESILIPANPNWWKQLKIRHRAKEGASYSLDAPERPSDDKDRYWDYHVRGVRRLDVVAKRNSSGNLSMMIEELSSPNNENSLLIGRCIHLDTDSSYGDEFTSAILNHLDLAINVYEGGNVESRFNRNLAAGTKVTDATFRTHLFRIEGIPLTIVLPYCLMFFQSKSLTGEWISDQFGRDNG